MTGKIKVLAGLGVAVPIAGVVGGTYFVTTKLTVTPQQIQPSSVTLSSPTSQSDHSPQIVRDSGHTLQETQAFVDSGTTVPRAPNSLENTDISVPVQLAKEEETTGNCTIINSLKKILEVAGQEGGEYYSVSCDNARMKGAREGNIPNKWEGVFPKSIFKRQDLGNDQKLEIKLREEDEEESFSDHDTGEEDWPFSITLSGNSFIDTGNSLISGKWDYYDDFDEEGKVTIKVKLTQQEGDKKIYLLWVLNENKKQ